MVSFTASHVMIVHHHATDSDFEITSLGQHRCPGQIILDEALLVVSSDLHVAAIFAEAEAELSFCNQSCLVHDIIDRFKLVLIRPRFLLRHSKDAICILRVEIVCLQLGAAEVVLEGISTETVVLSKVHLVPHNVAVVSAAFGVTLVEPTVVVVSALAVSLRAVV